MMFKLTGTVDENANRMRIITPIAERKQLNEDLILNSLVANFHTALDVKYALSDEVFQLGSGCSSNALFASASTAIICESVLGRCV